MKRKHRIELFNSAPIESAHERWYWRMKAPNGKIIADGSEAYSSKSKAIRALKSFCRATGYEGDVCHVAVSPDGQRTVLVKVVA